MSGHQSNLSLPQYGYDLVVSTTQESINATMKQFLDKFDGKDFISCYVSQEQSDGTYTDIPGDYDQISQIAGMDLFSIPPLVKLLNKKLLLIKPTRTIFRLPLKPQWDFLISLLKQSQM
jgi:hypothetical protein